MCTRSRLNEDDLIGIDGLAVLASPVAAACRSLLQSAIDQHGKVKERVARKIVY